MTAAFHNPTLIDGMGRPLTEADIRDKLTRTRPGSRIEQILNRALTLMTDSTDTEGTL